MPYGELMRLMDTLRAAGYLKVALVGLEGPPVQGAVGAGRTWGSCAVGAVRRSACHPLERSRITRTQPVAMSAHLEFLEGAGRAPAAGLWPPR